MLIFLCHLQSAFCFCSQVLNNNTFGKAFVETVLAWLMQKHIYLTLPFSSLPIFWLLGKAVGALGQAAACGIRDPKATERHWCWYSSCCQRGLPDMDSGIQKLVRYRSSCLRCTGCSWKYSFREVCTLYSGIRESTTGFEVRKQKAEEENFVGFWSCFGKIQRGIPRCQENVIFGWIGFWTVVTRALKFEQLSGLPFFIFSFHPEEGITLQMETRLGAHNAIRFPDFFLYPFLSMEVPQIHKAHVCTEEAFLLMAKNKKPWDPNLSTWHSWFELGWDKVTILNHVSR